MKLGFSKFSGNVSWIHFPVPKLATFRDYALLPTRVSAQRKFSLIAGKKYRRMSRNNGPLFKETPPHFTYRHDEIFQARRRPLSNIPITAKAKSRVTLPRADRIVEAYSMPAAI